MIEFVIFAALGKLLMVFIRKFPPAVWIAKKINFAIDCNLCLGFWVYLVLSFMYPLNVLDTGIPIWDEIIVAAATSWVMHVFVAGWNDLYGVYEVNTNA